MRTTYGSLITRTSQVAVYILLSTMLVTNIWAAENSTAHSLPYSKQQIEKALQRLRASSGGRLPTLYGFVRTEPATLDKYQRGFYQYKISVTATAPASSSVEITAEITAWRSDNDPANSSYQLLGSNGRLESDLLDRLESALKADEAPDASASTTNKSEPPSESLPDAPSVTRSAHLHQAPEARPPAMADVHPQPEEDGSAETRVRKLARELTVLKQIRDSQTTPDDLAVVIAPRTPVVSSPVKGAEVILYADADDELQVIGMDSDWVHVHLIGPSRGWVRRSQLDLSGVSISAPANSKLQPAAHPEAPFRKTREEVNTFPGNWKPLAGRKVSIVWIEPADESARVSESSGITYLQSLLRQQFSSLSTASGSVAGVVVVLDSADGGMVAATTSSLQRWHSGTLSDKSFLKECWFDPPDLFHSASLANKR